MINKHGRYSRNPLTGALLRAQVKRLERDLKKAKRSLAEWKRVGRK